METAVIFLSTKSLQKGDTNPTYLDCSTIAKRLNEIIFIFFTKLIEMQHVSDNRQSSFQF